MYHPILIRGIHIAYYDYLVSTHCVTKYMLFWSILAFIVPNTFSLYVWLYVSRYTPPLKGIPLSIICCKRIPPVGLFCLIDNH